MLTVFAIAGLALLLITNALIGACVLLASLADRRMDPPTAAAPNQPLPICQP